MVVHLGLAKVGIADRIILVPDAKTVPTAYVCASRWIFTGYSISISHTDRPLNDP